MNILKKILLGIGALIVLLLIMALFVKKDYTVVRQITIHQPDSLVFTYVKSLKNQARWSTWSLMDPKAKNTWRGEDSTTGFVWAWDSEIIGTGEQEIKKITEGARIDFELRFFKPYKSKSPVYLATEAVSAQDTKVTWAMEGHMPYPMNLMQLFMDMDQMIGTEYEKSLQNLKTLLEAPAQ